MLWQKYLWLPPAIINNELSEINSKNKLQELLQEIGNDLPIYSLISTSGPDHNQTFKIECTIKILINTNGEKSFVTISKRASAYSKKAAEQKAAEIVINEYIKLTNS